MQNNIKPIIDLNSVSARTEPECFNSTNGISQPNILILIPWEELEYCSPSHLSTFHIHSSPHPLEVNSDPILTWICHYEVLFGHEISQCFQQEIISKRFMLPLHLPK